MAERPFTELLSAHEIATEFFFMSAYAAGAATDKQHREPGGGHQTGGGVRQGVAFAANAGAED